MRITIIAAALRHGIQPAEIRAVVSYPVLRLSIAARRPDATPVLFIGRYDEHEPLIEVIGDVADVDHRIVFHAMMLRPNHVRNLGITELIDPSDLGPQRRDQR